MPKLKAKEQRERAWLNPERCDRWGFTSMIAWELDGDGDATLTIKDCERYVDIDFSHGVWGDSKSECERSKRAAIDKLNRMIQVMDNLKDAIESVKIVAD